jgi:hypothetical protein
MNKKAIRKNKVTRLKKQTRGKKPIRKKTSARKRKPMTKVAAEPEEIRSNAGALGSLPEVTDADGEPIVDVIEILEVGVLSTQDGVPNTDEWEDVPEETEEEVVQSTES